MNLGNLISELETNIVKSNVIKNSVSQRGVDWHIDHSLKVINNVSKILYLSDPKDYKWKFNLLRLILLTLGFFPRGKGKAPKAVNNKERISTEELVQQLNKARELVNKLSDIDEKSNFNHPYFGLLNLKKSKQFLFIHTKHHLKIINDIVK